MFDKAKTLMELRRIQKALSKEVVEVEAGNGAVVVQMTGEQKVKSIRITPEAMSEDSDRLPGWLESAVNQAITKSQQLAAEKMRDVAGGLGIPGL